MKYFASTFLVIFIFCSLLLLPSSSSASFGGDDDVFGSDTSAVSRVLAELTGVPDVKRAISAFEKKEYLEALYHSGWAAATIFPVAKVGKVAIKGATLASKEVVKEMSKRAARKIVEGSANKKHTAQYIAKTLEEQILKNSLATLPKHEFVVMAEGVSGAKKVKDHARLVSQYGKGTYQKVKYVMKSSNGKQHAEVHAYFDPKRNLLIEPKFK